MTGIKILGTSIVATAGFLVGSGMPVLQNGVLDFGRLLEMGIVGAAFLFLLRWLLTKFDDGQKRVARSVNTLGLLVIGMQKQLLAHDLTVTGINPSAGQTVGERADKALHKYSECQATLDEIHKAIVADMAA